MALSSWFARFDRFGSVHAVRSQDTIVQGGADTSNSCGIASILMVNFKQKKHLMLAGVSAGASLVSSGAPAGGYIGLQLMRAAFDQAVKEEPEIYTIYSSVTGSIYDGSTYTYSNYFPEVLRRLGLGAWESVNVGQAGVYDAVKAATDKGDPVIGHILRNNGAGHFVCIDETHTLLGNAWICVCDPWDGELRVISAASGATVNYDATSFVWSVSLGGNRHPSGSAPSGAFTGWIVRKRT